MVRDGIYCENQKEVVTKVLLTSKRSVEIAVAWINFQDYMNIFIVLLQKKIKVKIAVNDDIINRKYSENINHLISLGAEVKFISMPTPKNYMHHKFCIIDNELFMSGSFNWTKNANDNNYEDLIVSHDKQFLRGYISEFKAVWELSKDDLNLLRKPKLCENCREPKMIICVLNQDDEYSTQANLLEVCECGIEDISSEYFDISVYNNLIGIFDKYSDIDEYDYEINKEEQNEEMNFEISNYLSNVRSNRMNLPIIHAVGVYSWEWFTKDDGEYIIKILWKEKYTGNNILDKYSCDEFDI